MALISRDTGRTELAATLANADGLTHIAAFPNEASLRAHVNRTGMTIAGIEERPVYELVNEDTAPTMILDMDVRPTPNKAGFAWEVFNAQTGTTYARGIEHTEGAAELAAAKAITARTIHVRKGAAAWLVKHPDMGMDGAWIPLPFSPAATLDDVLAHVRSRPMARGLQVLAA
jgi:hypothetical protein